MEASSITHLTEGNFEQTAGQPGITVIDFWAGWCGPCRAMAPQFEKAAELRPQYRFAKVDVDAEPALAARFAIRSIPTLMVLRDGEPVAAQAGLIAAERLAEALDRIAGESARMAADLGLHTRQTGGRPWRPYSSCGRPSGARPRTECASD